MRLVLGEAGDGEKMEGTVIALTSDGVRMSLSKSPQRKHFAVENSTKNVFHRDSESPPYLTRLLLILLCTTSCCAIGGGSVHNLRTAGK